MPTGGAIESSDNQDQKIGEEFPDADDGPTSRGDPIFDEIHSKIERSTSHSTLTSLMTSNAEEYGGNTSDDFVSIPHGLLPKDAYEHSHKNTDIIGMTYNGRQKQFVILDSKGISTWKNDGVGQTTERPLTYPKYEYRVITNILYARKYNVYFALGKDFSLKVLNREFEETCSITSDMRSVLFMLFNPVKDELITGGIGGVRVWQYHQVVERIWKEIKPMANYRLDIKYELQNIGGHWVKRVDLDLNLQHLYCCSDTDLYAYDMEGHEMFRFEKAHEMSITGCAYSPHARLLLTASVDTFVKAWSITGGLVHTFRGHSRAVTNLILHPETSSMFITSSLDGSVRIWSLDTMEIFYNLTVSTDGVLWMGLTDTKLLYLGTMKNITTWSLNYVTQFWAQARNKVLKLSLVTGENKSTRVLAIGEDSSVRLFSRRTHKNLCTVLPPPSLSPLQQIRSVAYNRVVGIAFLLINTHEVWVYTTRTDPACRVAVWNVLEIQQDLMDAYQHSLRNGDVTTKGASSKLLSGNKLTHRATEHGTGNEMISACHCVCFLNSEAIMWTDEGLSCPLRHNYLLFGLEDGRILFMDPVVKGQKYFEFRANKDAIVNIEHDSDNQQLLTQCTVADTTLIQIWSLPGLSLLHDILCSSDITGCISMGASFFTCHSSGHVVMHNLVAAVDSLNAPSALRTLMNSKDEQETETSVEIQKADHHGAVVAISACRDLGIFCTASDDGMVKVWEANKTLLTEIVVDEYLSSACFLNSSGDLLIGYKNHIFIINHSKVCASIKVPDESEDDYEEESDVYEDPAVMYEGVVANPDPIDLNNYLVPFDIEFSKDLIEGKQTSRDKEKALDTKEEEIDGDGDDASELSAAPSTLYRSPPGSARRLSLLDLTLTADASSGDLQKQMRSTLGRSAGKGKKIAVVFGGDLSPSSRPASPIEMPMFGISPGSSPIPSTPSSISTPSGFDVSDVESLSDDEEEVKKEKTKKDTTFKPIKPKAVTETAATVKVKEPVPVKSAPAETRPGSSRLDAIRIDAQAILKEEAARLNREHRASSVGLQRERKTEQTAVKANVDKSPAETPARKVIQKKQFVADRKTPKREKRRAMELPVVKQKVSDEALKSDNSRRTAQRTVVKKTKTVFRKASLKKDAESSSSDTESDEPDKLTKNTMLHPDLQVNPRKFGASADAGVSISRSGQGARNQLIDMVAEKKIVSKAEGDRKTQEDLTSLQLLDGTKENAAKTADPEPATPSTEEILKTLNQRKSSTAYVDLYRNALSPELIKQIGESNSGVKPVWKYINGEKFLVNTEECAAFIAGELADEAEEVTESDSETEVDIEDPVESEYEDSKHILMRPRSILKGSHLPDIGSRSGTPGTKVSFVGDHGDDGDHGDSFSMFSQDPDSSVKYGFSSTYPIIHADISERKSSDVLSLDEARTLARGKSPYDRSSSPTFTIYSDYGSEWTVGAVDESEFSRLQEIHEGKHNALRSLAMETTEGLLSRRYAQSAGIKNKIDHSVERLKAWRPHTAHALPTNTKDLERQYLIALKMYKGVPGTEDFIESLHKNEGIKFDDSYHSKAIERHHLLRMQRQLRAQSAMEKREKLAQMQQEKWRKTPGHRSCAPPAPSPAPGMSPCDCQPLTPSEGLSWTPTDNRHRTGTAGRTVKSGKTSRLSAKRKEADEISARELSRATSARTFVDNKEHYLHQLHNREQSSKVEWSRPNTSHSNITHISTRTEKTELGTEMPFRISATVTKKTRSMISPPQTSSTEKKPNKGSLSARSPDGRRLTHDARPKQESEVNIRLFDPRNPESRFFKSISKSIPSKCTRYLLVANMDQKSDKIVPTPLEEQLIVERFPEWKEKWLDSHSPRLLRGHLLSQHYTRQAVNYTEVDAPH